MMIPNRPGRRLQRITEARITEALASRIKTAREEADKSLADLAKDLPISAAMLGKIEEGEISNPSNEVIEALEEALGISLKSYKSSTKEAFNDPDSLSTRLENVHRAFMDEFPGNPENGVHNYIEETYDDRVLARVKDETVQIPYEMTNDGVEFGEMTKVKVSLSVTPIEESTQRVRGADEPGPTMTILEALDDAEGRVWRVVMVRPGISKNRRRYRPEVLAEAVALYEGAKAFDGHRDDGTRRASSVSGLAGWHENVHLAPDGSIVSDFHIAESREDIRQLFLTAWKSQKPDLIGFSHDVAAVTENVVIDGKRISDVRKIVEVHSVDIVADPSAGGRIERLVASRQTGGNMELEDFLRALRAGELSEEQIKEAYEDHPEWERIVEAAEISPKSEDPDPPKPESTPDPAASASGELTGAVREMVIESALDRHKLPEAARTRVREALEGVGDEAQITRVIEETADIWQSALAARPAALPGQNRAEITETEEEKLRKGLDAMISKRREIDGVPAFKSLKEAYVAFTGRNPYQMGDEDFNRWILAESVGAVPYAGAQRLTESLTTASWAEALGDSIRRQLIAEYNADALGSWRSIVSEIENLPDFRTNRRVRVGGYDVLPSVAEGAAYTSLTSPTDEEATYAGSKKGGTEDLTLETIANDDLGAVRRIPTKMGRAAALTLYRAIWNTTIAGNATIFDAVALFDDASHNNDNATTPLDEAGLSLLRRRMMRQTIPGESSGFVGLMPRFLVVPPDLYVSAYKLTQSEQAVVGSAESATTPNPFRGLEPIEVPTFTDTNDWFLVADPGSVPTIEVGYYQGRQDPELFVQDQPAVGSVFTNDKITYKIRHIWGLAVLDFRGFQRATQV